jgi:hypothetical protein
VLRHRWLLCGWFDLLRRQVLLRVGRSMLRRRLLQRRGFGVYGSQELALL